MRSKAAFLLLIIAWLVSCTSDSDRVNYGKEELFSSDKSDIKAYNLVSPQSAFILISDNSDKFIPVQVSKRESFRESHIPGAQNVWRPDYTSEKRMPYRGLIPSLERLEALLQRLGFQEGQTLMLYDTKANVDALRLAWIFNLYGFEDFKIINGGLENWKLQRLAVHSGESRQVMVSDYQLKSTFNSSIIADFDDILAAIEDSNSIIIDTREDYEYHGTPFLDNSAVLPFKSGAFERGCIPTAIHLNWSTLADLNGDHRIKSEKDLLFDLKKRSIHKNKQIFLYCHSGSRTSHTYYVLKHVLGYPNVKNYDGSWIEWSYKYSLDSTVPIQKLSSDSLCKMLADSLTSSLM